MTAGVGTVAAGVLAAVLAWAGVAKLRWPDATAAGFAGLGVPGPRLLARAVPIWELSLALALPLRPAAAAAAALATLAAFTGLLAVRLRQGPRGAGEGGAAGAAGGWGYESETTGCGCFGRARAVPVSSVEIVRNLLLVILALPALGAPRPVPPGLDVLVTVGAATAAGAVAVALLELRRATGRLWDNRLPAGPGGPR